MSIQNMLVRTYINFDDAQKARNALLDAGFPPDAISFTAKEDEAGPVAGNFMIDREADPCNRRNASDMSEGYEPNEVQDTRPVEWGASHVLMVDADDAQQLQRATEIAERFGGIDIDQVASGHQATRNP